MILLVSLNPVGFPVRGGLLSGDIAYFSHGSEAHSICPMFGFSALHVVGNANIHQFAALVTLILVGVSFMSHNESSISGFNTLLSDPA